jgi:uncharacterized membrane protein
LKRVLFVDLARTCAVVFMVYGHTIDALLAPAYRQGRWFDLWQFQRGMTAPLFLLLSGFVFSLVTGRHWEAHLHPGAPVARRVARFTTYIALGYLIHFPAGSLSGLADVSPARWRMFAAVDVLQLIGVSLLMLQGLALGVAVAVVALTPAVWLATWTAAAPVGVAAYLTRATGSQFPFFPWAGYVLLGAAVGTAWVAWGRDALDRFANQWLLGGGLVLLAVWQGAALLDLPPVAGVSASGQPTLFLMRAGTALVGLGLLAHATRALTRLPAVVGALAQESLVVYVLHLCVVYGSAWNTGLAQAWGATLGPGPTIVAVVAVLGGVLPVAWGWHRLKHWRPAVARWAGAGVAAALLLALL